jgi:protein ImuB
LLDLPVAALRVGDKVAELCRRLGLTTIGDLYPLPRRTLAARFGLAAVRRLEQALGEEDEPLDYLRFRTPLRAALSFPEPIVRTGDVEEASAIVIERLCARLEKEGQGVRLAVLAFERVDGGRQTLPIATATPSRSQRLLLQLVRDRFDGLDAGFGIERVEIEAKRCDPLAAEQVEVLGERGGVTDANDSDLIDRLVNRFGHECVLRFAPADSHLPDRAYLTFSAASAPPCSSWNAPPMARPTRLLSHPQPVAKLIDAALPKTIDWRGQRLPVTPLAGPERIEPEWWHDDPAWRSGARDYWWMRSACGQHFWLFRVGEGSCRARSRWFLHGLGG